MQNIVGTFDHDSSARLALEQLRAAGFEQQRLRYTPPPGAQFVAHAGPSAPRPGHPGYRPQGVLESIGGFFANLFESHTDESGIYGEALRRGTAVLLVQAEDAAQARRAIAILQDSGAVSLEERVGQWRVDGWSPPAPPAA